MVKIVIFELDNTILNVDKIPRQTYHLLYSLKKSGFIIGIVSKNIFTSFIANTYGLNDYASFIKWGNLDHDKLVYNTLEYLKSKFKLNNNLIEEIFYIDSNKENLELVAKAYPNINTYNCESYSDLYLFKKII